MFSAQQGNPAAGLAEAISGFPSEIPCLAKYKTVNIPVIKGMRGIARSRYPGRHDEKSTSSNISAIFAV
ncbi:MAG: hypothetical protein P8Y58_10410 [Novosphingobium sp.]